MNDSDEFRFSPPGKKKSNMTVYLSQLFVYLLVYLNKRLYHGYNVPGIVLSVLQILSYLILK